MKAALSAEAPSTPAGLVHSWLDRLVVEYGEGAYRSVVAQAREEYFTRAGKVFEDDAEIFDSRIKAFLEWYVIECPLPDGPPPVIRALAKKADLSPSDTTVLGHIASSHRSLFDVALVTENSVLLEDLLGGARFSVSERRSTAGFELGDILEARLIWNGDEIIFGKTFLFHPRDARVEVLAAVDGGLDKGTPRDEILFRLSRRHLRWVRLNHQGAERIYRAPAP